MRIIERVKNKIVHELLRLQVQCSRYEYGLNTQPRSEKIIISLTSYPKRFQKIELCIKSLLLQEMKADRIIIWLGSDTTEEDLVPLKKYTEYGVEFRIDGANNFRSHKKYLYALKEFADDLVITVDDDLIYSKNLVKSLVETYHRYPNCVAARRVHRITWNEDGSVKRYLDWNGECTDIVEPSHELLATTGAGVLYPPRMLNKGFDNTIVMLKYSFLADDIWMKFMEIINDVKVVWVGNRVQMPTTIDLKQTESLAIQNCEGNNNDVCFQALLDYYGLSRNDFIDS